MIAPRSSKHPVVQDHIERAADGLPILRGVITSVWWVVDPLNPDREYMAGQIKVPCPYCWRRGRRDFHFHGWTLGYGPDAICHRGAHCGDFNSPLQRHGYYISIDPNGRHVVDPLIPQYRPSRQFRRQQLAKRIAASKKECGVTE